MTDPLGERVARVEAVLPEIRDDVREVKRLLKERLEDQDRRLQEVDSRIAALERWRSYVLGSGAAVGTAAGFLGRSPIDWLRGQ